MGDGREVKRLVAAGGFQGGGRTAFAVTSAAGQKFLDWAQNFGPNNWPAG
jgi:hypothetical protein